MDRSIFTFPQLHWAPIPCEQRQFWTVVAVWETAWYEDDPPLVKHNCAELWQSLSGKRRDEKDDFLLFFDFQFDIHTDPDEHAQEFQVVLDTFQAFRTNIAGVAFHAGITEDEKRALLSVTPNLVVLGYCCDGGNSEIFNAIPHVRKMERISSLSFHNAEQFQACIQNIARFPNLNWVEIILYLSDQNASDVCDILSNLRRGPLPSIESMDLSFYCDHLTEKGLPKLADFLASRDTAIEMKLYFDDLNCFQNPEVATKFMTCLAKRPPTKLVWQTLSADVPGNFSLEAVASIAQCMKGPESSLYVSINMLEGQVQLSKAFLQALSETKLCGLSCGWLEGSTHAQRDKVLEAFSQNTTTTEFKALSFDDDQKKQCDEICERNKIIGKIRKSIHDLNMQRKSETNTATTGLEIWPSALQQVHKLGHHSATPAYIIVGHMVGVLSESGHLS